MGRFSRACAIVEAVNPMMDARMYLTMYEREILAGCNGKIIRKINCKEKLT